MMWPRERTWVEGSYNSGWLVPGVMCPDCKEGRVVYNGNYFCENLGYEYNGERRGGPCDWALGEVHTIEGKRPKAKDRKMWKRICEATEIDPRE